MRALTELNIFVSSDGSDDDVTAATWATPWSVVTAHASSWVAWPDVERSEPPTWRTRMTSSA